MNKELQNTIVQFWGKILIFLFPIYWIHKYIYTLASINIDDYWLQLSYFANGLLAIFIFSILLLLKKKHGEQLGFLYILGSLIKFGVFFLLFYPEFKSDGEITNLEFSVFFTPYLLSLIIETTELIKILNNTENKEN